MLARSVARLAAVIEAVAGLAAVIEAVARLAAVIHLNLSRMWELSEGEQYRRNSTVATIGGWSISKEPDCGALSDCGHYQKVGALARDWRR